jgi:curved DNA-binding protein CbpA
MLTLHLSSSPRHGRPIAEPVEVFRSCLERFKQQVDGDDGTLAESMEQARRLLELQEGDGSKELRRAYRSMARRYHP